MNALTSDDWKYLAGLFDGEGCVVVSSPIRQSDTLSCRTGQRVMNLSLRIANNDPIVLKWLERNFGGRVRQDHRPKASYTWIVAGDLSVVAAKKLAKYSRMKRKQLELYVALAALRGRQGVNITDAEWRQRDKLIAQIKASPYRRGNGLRLVRERDLG